MREITRAAVKIYDNKQQKEVIIPCHRHCDAFQILHDLGFKIEDYKIIEQGFLDNEDNFLDRKKAYRVAWDAEQVNTVGIIYKPTELFSEDIW